MFRVALVSILPLLLGVLTLAVTEFYVSPGGNDANPDTRGVPCATLAVLMRPALSLNPSEGCQPSAFSYQPENERANYRAGFIRIGLGGSRQPAVTKPKTASERER